MYMKEHLHTVDTEVFLQYEGVYFCHLVYQFFFFLLLCVSLRSLLSLLELFRVSHLASTNFFKVFCITGLKLNTPALCLSNMFQSFRRVAYKALYSLTAGLQGAAVFSVSSAADYWPLGGAAQSNADRHTLHMLYHCNATQRRSSCMQTQLNQCGHPN